MRGSTLCTFRTVHYADSHGSTTSSREDEDRLSISRFGAKLEIDGPDAVGRLRVGARADDGGATRIAPMGPGAVNVSCANDS